MCHNEFQCKMAMKVTKKVMWWHYIKKKLNVIDAQSGQLWTLLHCYVIVLLEYLIKV